MINNDEDIKELSISKFLEAKANYIIPIYQRNYAWGEGEIIQLIQDIIDYLPKANSYYIGTLVVFERNDSKVITFEVIDGQQRLTTLSLLIAYLKNKKTCGVSKYENLTIDFDCREHSQLTLNKIFQDDDPLKVLEPEQINSDILNGYQLIQKHLPRMLKEHKKDHKEFANFILNYVKIMQVKVPEDTNLNHYFEIMNNRGEQLEKYEVLKSRMMATLKDDPKSQNGFNMVWEACANMENYVQMGFSTNQRDAIFGDEDWNSFLVSNFCDLCEKTNSTVDNSIDNETEQTLNEIIGGYQPNIEQDKNGDSQERFNTIINFPNFLLHVLRVQTKTDIALDDKGLLDTFEASLLNGDNDAAKAKKVKEFIFNLLRCKYRYDQYVIKREFLKGTDKWCLKRISKNKENKSVYYKNTFGGDDENESDNRKILMLLSAFHVSTPTLDYKHWLSAALNYLFDHNNINANEYLKYLESVAKSFVLDRFLSKGDGLDYFTIIFNNGGNCKATKENVLENLETKLSFNNIQNNLIFNFLDYLLWVQYKPGNEDIKDYEFTFRSSVEHYYPQNPMEGYEKLDQDILNSFGNLCLISHDKNSRLSNLMPIAKKEYYKNNKIDSIKQYIMMNDYENWNSDSIEKHYNDMKGVLLKSL